MPSISIIPTTTDTSVTYPELVHHVLLPQVIYIPESKTGRAEARRSISRDYMGTYRCLHLQATQGLRLEPVCQANGLTVEKGDFIREKIAALDEGDLCTFRLPLNTTHGGPRVVAVGLDDVGQVTLASDRDPGVGHAVL